MSQIYVVCKQVIPETEPWLLVPVAAYNDYPTAYAYAQTIYVRSWMEGPPSAKELIFMISLTPTVVVPPVVA